jgi:hypothetical protein
MDTVLFSSHRFGVLHSVWLAVTLLVTLAAAAWYAWTASLHGRWPGGGSWPGLVLGVAAAAICLFEFALVFRKSRWFRTRRTLFGFPLGSARFWMAAHLWLGLLVVPLVALHAGFRFGGNLSWLLAWSLIVVIASGVFGLVMQNILPRLLTEAVPDETAYSQIDEVGEQFAADALRLARLYGGPADDDRLSDPTSEPAARGAARAGRATVVGAPRRVGTIVPRSRHPQVDLPAAADSPELHRALQEDVVAFLRTGRSPSGRLSRAAEATWYFDDLRRRVRPEARPAVDEIETLCSRRRQLNLQQRLHVWLHGWMSIHLPLSAAMMLLLVAHVVGALVYS